MNIRVFDAMAAEDLAEGEVESVDVNEGLRVAIYRVENEFFATDDKCSHGEASLSEGWLEGHCIECPVHAGQFDVRDGKPMCFPATEPVKTYHIWEEKGRVLIDLSS